MTSTKKYSNPATTVPELKAASKENDFGFNISDCSIKIDKCYDEKKQKHIILDDIIENLPGAKYVGSTFTQLLYANGLYSENEADDKKLQDFLNQVNQGGFINADVLYSALETTNLHGGVLLRIHENTLITINPRHFDVVVLENKANRIKAPIGYEIREDYRLKQRLTNYDNLEPSQKLSLISEDVDLVNISDKVYILSKKATSYIKLGTEYRSESPFFYDRLRIELIYAALNRNIDDLTKDGIGRVFLFKNNTNPTETYTTQAIASRAVTANQQASEQQAKDILESQKMANSLKNSGSDTVVMLDGDKFKDNIVTIPRQVKASEYISLIDNAIKLACNAYGLPTGIFGVSDTGYSANMKPLLEFSERNYIQPTRERLAKQLSEFFKKQLGITSELKFRPLEDTDLDTIAKTHQIFIQNARQLVEIATPLGEAKQYLNENIDTKLDTTSTTELLATNLTTAEVV